MPRSCYINGCRNRESKIKKRFFRLPSAMKRGNDLQIILSAKRRLAWLKAMKRTNISELNLKYVLICEDHFISGQPSSLLDENSPDWIPTQKLGDEGPSQSAFLHSFKEIKVEKEVVHPTSKNHKSTKQFYLECSGDETSTERNQMINQETQTELTMNDISDLMECNSNYVLKEKDLKISIVKKSLIGQLIKNQLKKNLEI